MHEDLKNTLRAKLTESIGALGVGLDASPAGTKHLRARIEQTAARLLRRQWSDELSPAERSQILDELVAELLGLGPLERLLHEPAVSEIMVNGAEAIYVERAGRIERIASVFPSVDALMTVIERMLAPVGRRVTEAEPYVDARLPDGSRVNVVIPPAAIGAPYVTIRKFSKAILSLDDLIAVETLTPQAASFLESCVKGRLNIIVSGPASSGKTTLLNLLATAIPAGERVVILEDTAELQLASRHHAVRLETRPANIEGKGEITLRSLLKNALHMRPDRLIVGEVRGPEALDMLQAMTTGHDGSMSTVHANNAADVLSRLAVMALTTMVELSDAAIERQVRSALDLIIHMERFADGTRKIMQISEVRKDPEPGAPALLDLFILADGSRTGGAPPPQALVPTGHRPAFLERLGHYGVSLPEAMWAGRVP